MERFLQVVGESGFPLKDYMTYEILGTIMYNIQYIKCKSIYLFINCVFCLWKLHRNPGTRRARHPNPHVARPGTSMAKAIATTKVAST